MFTIDLVKRSLQLNKVFLLLENHYVCSMYMNKQFPETLKYEVHFTKNYIEFNLALENPEYLVFQCVGKSVISFRHFAF